METVSFEIELDEQIKEKFEQVCETIGITPEEAIKVFIHAVVRYRGIPFEIRAISN